MTELADRPGWASDHDGTKYEYHDRRLLGYGMPPMDPGFQLDPANIGKGQRPLDPVELAAGPAVDVEPAPEP